MEADYHFIWDLEASNPSQLQSAILPVCLPACWDSQPVPDTQRQEMWGEITKKSIAQNLRGTMHCDNHGNWLKWS
jgi:hypothetical protein